VIRAEDKRHGIDQKDAIRFGGRFSRLLDKRRLRRTASRVCGWDGRDCPLWGQALSLAAAEETAAELCSAGQPRAAVPTWIGLAFRTLWCSAA
jgi:hypothetical protein